MVVATVPARRGTRQHLVVLCSIVALTLYLMLHSLAQLLGEVQVTTGSSFGGLSAVGGGFRADFIARTQALLDVWRSAAQPGVLGPDAATQRLISVIAISSAAVDTAFLAVVTVLVLHLWQRLLAQESTFEKVEQGGRSAGQLRLLQLRVLARWHRWWIFIVAAGAADVLQNTGRIILTELAVHQRATPGWLIAICWVGMVVKFTALGICALTLVAGLVDTSLPRGWWAARGALWRLRLPVAGILAYALLLLFDPTGQAFDLVRRWLDGGWAVVSGVLVLAGSALLGLAVWVLARRLVLSDQAGDGVGRDARWRFVLPALVVVALVLRFGLGWRESLAIGLVAFVIGALSGVARLLGLYQKRYVGGSAAASSARSRDAQAPDAAVAEGVRRLARGLAVLPMVTVLVIAAVANAPVPMVLGLSGEHVGHAWLAAALVLVGLAGAPLVAFAGCEWLRHLDTPDRPSAREQRYKWVTAAVGVVFLLVMAGAFTHVPVVSALLVLPVFLAGLLIALCAAQRWSEVHQPPRGLLLIGFTRVPTSALLAVTMFAAAFLFSNGSEHAVHRSGALPAGLSRSGVDLGTAFDQWVAANCAGAGTSGSPVPLVLVAAPGGGVRAAYWTSSVLSRIFGAQRAGDSASCPGASGSDRIFAMGGASGGSLGETAYVAGLDDHRTPDWYDQQLAAPDSLTDPLAWMVTVDLARGLLGFPGEDRARRLENEWTSHISGAGGDFLAGTWGLGGRNPLMLLTSTQVETGCRVNVGGLRLTQAPAHVDETSCTAPRTGIAQEDPADVADLLDNLCGPRQGSAPSSLSYATAALLSARFPYVSPSGQLYRCHRGTQAATPTSVVDGGYAENTGIGTLLDLWPRLEKIIATHNTTAGMRPIVPVFLDIDSVYAQVAAPTEPASTIELLVPPTTRDRPDRLAKSILEGRAAADFYGPVPGGSGSFALSGATGRYFKITPHVSPGLPAPLAWTLSELATDDLAAQRTQALNTPPVRSVEALVNG